MLVLLISEN